MLEHPKAEAPDNGTALRMSAPETHEMGNQQERSVALARLAMFIDCEGWISINVQFRGGDRARNLNPIVGFVNTNVEMVSWLINTLTALHIPHYVYWLDPKKYGSCTGKVVQGRVTILGVKRVAKLLPLILPFLIVKKRNAELLGEFIESRLSVPRGLYSERELEIANEIRNLNVKGRGWRPSSSETARSGIIELRERLDETMIQSDLLTKAVEVAETSTRSVH